MEIRTLVHVLFWVAFVSVVFVLPTYIIGNLVIRGLRAADRRAEQKNAQRFVGELLRTKEKRERSFLKPCTNCGVFSLTLPHRDRLGRTYCSKVCAEWLGEGPRDFCERCQRETTDVSAGDLNQINGIGTALIGSKDRCDQCGSDIRRVWFTILFVPILPLARYRVIQISRLQFFSRRLR